MRLTKAENVPLTLAIDTAITMLEAGYDLPPGVKRGEVNHSLIMMRSLRSRLLREAVEAPSDGTSPTKQE